MTYTIDTQSNSYFNGRDAVLVKDGKRVALLAPQDSGPGVNVKHQFRLGTNETRAMRDDLPEERLDALLEHIQGDFWETLAPEIARKHGFVDVYQEGRSGGWCVPFPDGDWLDEISIVPDTKTPDEDEAAAIEARGRFFDFAVEITELVESLRTGDFDERVREEHAEWLEEKAEQAVEASRHFTLFVGDDDTDKARDANSYDYHLSRAVMIKRVIDALKSIDEGGLVIRLNVTRNEPR